MASDAERASNIKAAWHCSDCRREGEAQIVTLLAEVRLEERKKAALGSTQWERNDLLRYTGPRKLLKLKRKP